MSDLLSVFAMQQPNQVKLPTNMVHKFQDAVLGGTLGQVMELAYSYVSNKFTDKPAGQSAPVKEAADVKQLAHADYQTLFSASIGFLKLDSKALPSLDVGRTSESVSKCTTVGLMVQMIGKISVNVSNLFVENGFKDLQRADKDAEIAAACFVAHLCKDDENITKALKLVFSDMVFDARDWGTGADATMRVLAMVETEESSRSVIGLSSFNKAALIQELYDVVVNPTDGNAKKDDLSKLREPVAWAKKRPTSPSSPPLPSFDPPSFPPRPLQQFFLGRGAGDALRVMPPGDIEQFKNPAAGEGELLG